MSIGWHAAAVLAIAGCSAGTDAREKAMATQVSRAIEVGLQLSATPEGGVAATLTFTNRSPQPYQLLKWLTFPTGRIDAKRFEVLVNGRPAEYTGMLKKRDAAGPDDFGTLAPNHFVSSTVNLSDAYALPPGSEVSVTYAATNPPFGARDYGDKLRSNTVTFRR